MMTVMKETVGPGSNRKSRPSTERLRILLAPVRFRRSCLLDLLLPIQFYVEAFTDRVRILSDEVRIRQPVWETELMFHDVRSSAEALSARLGFGLAVLHTETTFEGEHREQYDVTFPTAPGALGFGRRVWKAVNLLLETKFSYISARGVRIPDGWADTRLLAHHFLAGLGAVF